MDYQFKPSALKNFEKLPRQIQRRIIAKLDFYVSTADPLEFAEPIRDESLGQFRFRIGDYRVIFDVVGNVMVILIVGHRRDVYK